MKNFVTSVLTASAYLYSIGAMMPRCVADGTTNNAELVANIGGNMNLNANPCTNFWQYACGSWTAAPTYDHVDTFGAVANSYSDKLQTYLEGTVGDVEMGKLLDKMRAYYASCNAAINTPNHLRLREYLKAMVHGMESLEWPPADAFFDASLKNSAKWIYTVAHLRRYGLNNLFFSAEVSFAASDSERYVVELDIPDEVHDFQLAKNEILNYLGMEFGGVNLLDSATLAGQLAVAIYELEIQLRALRSKYRQKSVGDAQENTLTLSSLRLLVPGIDWQTYFSLLLPTQTPPQTLPVELTIQTVTYLKDLAALMQQMEASSVTNWYIYMRLCKFLTAISPHLHTGRSCVQHMEVSMALGMDYLYQQKLHKARAEDERAIDLIVQQLKLQFNQYLQGNKMQLHSLEIQYLQRKLHKLKWRLGNLPLRRDASYYNDFYKDAKVSAYNFYANHLEMLRHRTYKQYERLVLQEQQRELFNIDDYFVDDDFGQVRSAPYFVTSRNLLIVPAIFTQLPFFHHRLHPLFQHSLMGWILGHEISHGFDVDGILLDGDGKRNPLGLRIQNNAAFRAGVHCLQATPTASLNERMADINGLQLAYDAYFERRGTTSCHAANYGYWRVGTAASVSAKRLFFLSFAQFFCGNLPIAIDHDRDDVRVMQIVANMPEFSEVFKCGRTPQQKCQMWR